MQKGIRADLIASLTIASQPTASGAGLQAALANGWGKLQNIYEDDTIETVYFLNPEDVADYLGGATITVQTAFGFSYVENFLGLGTAIMNSQITKGTYKATAKENMVAYYVPADESELAKVFDFTTDETGLIGIHEYADYERMTADDTVISGIKVFADNESGVVAGTISPLA